MQAWGTKGRHDFDFRDVEFKAAKLNLRGKLRRRDMDFERWLKNNDSSC